MLMDTRKRKAKKSPSSEYFGEVAIHFKGGGKPLLLSISEQQHEELFYNLQRDYKFLTVKSLQNQTVVFRAAAISDLYFSHDAYDTVGPEQVGSEKNNYEGISSAPYLPNRHDWDIIEALKFALDGAGDDLDAFDAANIDRIYNGIVFQEERLQQAITDGDLDPEHADQRRDYLIDRMEQTFALTHMVSYQLSTGAQRTIDDADDKSVYDAFAILMAECRMESANDADIEVIVFSPCGGWREIFINPDALDYVLFPSHWYARAEATDESQ